MYSPDIAKDMWDVAPGLHSLSGVIAGSRGLEHIAYHAAVS